jgi:hypothetical protein
MADTGPTPAQRRGRRWKTGLAACALAVATTIPALAAPSEAEHAAAVQSFRRGTQLVEAGRIEDAIKAFRDALQHEPSSVGARLDLADCYEKIGSPAAAWREYALADAYAHKANDRRQEMARSSLRHIEASLLVLTLTGDGAAGAELSIDGEPVAEEIVVRGTLAVAPGRHQIALSAPGKKALAWEVQGGAGETQAVTLNHLEAEPVAAAIHAAPASKAGPTRTGLTGSTQRTWGVALGIVGLAGIALGSVAGGVALGDRSNLQREAHDPSVGAARFYADRSSADTFATLSTVAFIGGGIVLAGGTSLYLWPVRSQGLGATIAGNF